MKINPLIILHKPQLGSNIGMVARAMLNCGLTQLRLISPKESWPNEKARDAAVGADEVLDQAQVFGSLEEAVADVAHLYATTARPRFMQKPSLELEVLPTRIRESQGVSAVLFGCESAGLPNKAIVLADALIHISVNPAFSSLNLAQAVFAVAHTFWCTSGQEAIKPFIRDEIAPKKELLALFEHLESELDASGFLFPLHKREKMVQNLRTFLMRSSPTLQEVRTLRGVIRALVEKPYSYP